VAMSVLAIQTPGEALRLLTRKAGMTQAEVARRSGISRQTISAYYSDAHRMDARTWAILVDVLARANGVDPTELRTELDAILLAQKMYSDDMVPVA